MYRLARSPTFSAGAGEVVGKKMRGYMENSKDFDPHKQEAFDMTVMRTYDELDSEKMVLDALYEDYAILKKSLNLFPPLSPKREKYTNIENK